MRIIIVGCGRVGSTLSYQLYKNGNQVVVIDKDFSAFDNLPLDFHGRTIEGDVLAQNVLHRAEVEHADALAAVTNSDTLNALVAHIAKTEFGVSKVVARNYDPTQLPLQEAFDISIVGSAGWGVQRIEELITNEPLSHVFLSSDMNFAIYQLIVPENWHGLALQALLPDEAIKVIELNRKGQHLASSGSQLLETGDIIYLSADPEQIETLRTRLGIQQEKST
jgi:trk/ktr system potassium uptake protein